MTALPQMYALALFDVVDPNFFRAVRFRAFSAAFGMSIFLPSENWKEIGKPRTYRNKYFGIREQGFCHPKNNKQGHPVLSYELNQPCV